MSSSSSLPLTISTVLLLSLTFLSNVVLIPMHTNLILTATLIVYLGAHRSLRGADEEAGEKQRVMETMKRKDAMMFPIFAGGTLLGLYALFTFLDPAWVNFAITLYMAVVGIAICANEFQPVFKLLTPSKTLVFEMKMYIPFSYRILGGGSPPPVANNNTSTPSRGDEGDDNDFDPRAEIQITRDNYLHVRLTPSALIALLAGIVVTVWYVKTKHFVANNLLAAAMSLQALELLSLGSYKTGAILLCLLFFYDIFFVFGTDVMVTVAKSVDAPIKLLFPKAFAQPDADAQFSMLGLGDVVLPGVFVALLLRLDARRAGLELGRIDHETTEFAKPFFNVAIFFYAAGLCATVLVMHLFRHAQPALLYLVPAVLLASLLSGWWLGAFKEMWNYEEGNEEQASTAAAPAASDTKKTQ